jgi:hypothetical protein
LPFQTLTEQFAPNDFYRKVEATITLPYEMTLEHIEFQMNNNQEIFQKYLKLLKIEKLPRQSKNSDLLLVKGGAFIDKAKK